MDLIPFGQDPFAGMFPAIPQFFKAPFPRVDVQETAREVIVTADIPGIDPKKVDVEIAQDYIKISGTVQTEKETKNKNFYRKERTSQSFHRVIPLPCLVLENEARAVAKNGMLTIKLSKKRLAEPKKMRKIPVEEA